MSIRQIKSKVCAGLIISFFCIGTALAADPVELKIITQVVLGQQPAGLQLIAHQAIQEGILKVNGKTYSSGAIPQENAKLITIAQKVGIQNYKGTLDVTFENGQSGSMPIQFSLTVLEGLKLAIEEGSFSLADKHFQVRASRPLRSLTYTIISDTGSVLDEGKISFDTPPAENLASVTWREKPGTIIRIDLTVTDTTGTFAKLELSPWRVDVDHEEITFPSGSDAILKDEAPKLDHAYGEIQKQVEKYGKLIQVNLYIVGYTDTVGKPQGNLALSARRAKSIAHYFQKKGFTFPIYYQGFGEEILAIPTDDETDEIRNRRALYILGGDFRPTGLQIPRDNWTRLK